MLAHKELPMRPAILQLRAGLEQRQSIDASSTCFLTVENRADEGLGARVYTGERSIRRYDSDCHLHPHNPMC
jgi:hypothetical protein